MTIFALKKIEEITGVIEIYKLLINGNCEFDDFEKATFEDSILSTELITVQTRLLEIAKGRLLPKEKFRNITPEKVTIKEYEIKTRHLRVYLFHEEKTGNVIVCGGYKNTQKKDIRHFRRIKHQYFKFLSIKDVKKQRSDKKT